MNLVRSAVTVGGMTAISRVLGFLRDVLIASALGTGPIADAFFVAFRFPNLFRRLFAEGAFNSAFVPLFARRLEGEGSDGARRFADEALSVLTWTLIAFTAVCELAMPLIIYLLAPGFADTPDKLGLAMELTRIAFPYLTFMSLVALVSGVLNSLGRFTAAAAAPIVLNVVLIAVLAAVSLFGLSDTPAAGRLLAWGVAVAGTLQLAMVYAAAKRAGMAPRLVRPRITAGVKRLIALGVPGVIAGGIIQVNIVIGTIIASLQDGAVSYLYYADRVYQLPLGVVGIAIGVVLLPDLARRLRAGDDVGARASQDRACEFSMLITVPAAVALAVVATPVISVLFEHGAFGDGDTEATAQALAAFALGLPAFVLIKVFSPGFFAREDTRTPMAFAAAGVAVNVAGSLALFFVIGHVGIAIATTLAGWVNAGLLVATLIRRGHYAPGHRLKRKLALIVAASVAMGVVLIFARDAVEPWLAADGALSLRVGALAALVATGVAVYWIGAESLGAGHIRELVILARRRPQG